jgi:HSP20 family protein
MSDGPASLKTDRAEEPAMALLEKWRPPRELERFRHELDDLLERFGLEHNWIKEWESLPLRPALESFVDKDQFTVRVDLPGVDPNDVEVKVTSGLLTIKGHRYEKQESKTAHYLRRERRYGVFERVMQLPEGVRGEDLKAHYRGGVLELTARLPQEAAAKEIKVQVGKPPGTRRES